jgi:anti-sigma regulatory factor (Ser/Thr protein kinase)
VDKAPNRTIRDLVRGLLTGQTGVTVEDAVLVTEELVSNARVHGDGPRTCRLALHDQGRCLRIEVDDTSPDPPRPRTPDSAGGRGLVLVDQLAAAWGVHYYAHHKTVWAELAFDHPCRRRAHAPYLTAVRNFAQPN